MEELLTLKSLLLKGDTQGALAIVEELEEMSRDDKIKILSVQQRPYLGKVA